MPLALRRVEFGSSVQYSLIIKYMQITRDHGIDHLHIVVVDDVPERFDCLVGHLHDIVRQVLWRESPIGKPDTFNTSINIERNDLSVRPHVFFRQGSSLEKDLERVERVE